MTDHVVELVPVHEDDEHGFRAECKCGWKAELVRPNSGDGYDAATRDGREHAVAATEQ